MKHFKCIKGLFLFALILVTSCQDADDRVVITQPQLTPTATCPQPTTVSITNITQTTATLSWVNGGSETQWEVGIVPPGSPPPSVGMPITTNPYMITGLVSGTSYECYIKGICSSTDSSIWSGPFPFTTN
jgi:hypothetical protein